MNRPPRRASSLPRKGIFFFSTGGLFGENKKEQQKDQDNGIVNDNDYTELFPFES